ncbi:MAG: succinate dehydrogenase assembly factor 2 [Gammaproteobacteria bacterium]|nr:succinate dehydrogenase assembly factor 2 [Gammaproteobacteria bacterium]
MSEQNEISASQLRWRCRRGMLELDMLLNAYVEMEYDNLSAEDKALFLKLLDYQDQELLGFLLEKKEPSDVTISALITKIRSICNSKFNCMKAIE